MNDRAAQLRKRFPNASPAFWKLNEAHLLAEDSGAAAELERSPGDVPARPHAAQEAPAGRVRLRYTIVRRRTLDPENCYTKCFTDCLRAHGIIRDDRDEDIILEVSQRKAAKGEEEETLIEVFQIENPL